ncbi:hypothetical protein Pcinc_042586 [Petrolisthes cinctipes]|uniref:Uncharacterized protein n=1 Tax=Petrolisthes cinctipes TaxID=88211 RepID=A0AAE1BKW3_PETCI|nr:hypothetical protein Pcinc_042586 [Petrolisthes cinctipes]
MGYERRKYLCCPEGRPPLEEVGRQDSNHNPRQTPTTSPDKPLPHPQTDPYHNPRQTPTTTPDQHHHNNRQTPPKPQTNSTKTPDNNLRPTPPQPQTNSTTTQDKPHHNLIFLKHFI